MKARLIARLDIKGDKLIKGIQLEGLRVIGDPNLIASEYYSKGIDEFIFMDSVASLYGRNQLGDIIHKITENIFVPITVGGGLRTLEDCRITLRNGADKIAINTSALANKKIITEVANEFGSQCMVVSIDAKKVSDTKWNAYVNNGRDSTQLDVIEWAIESAELGAGEILLTSIDREGTRSGFDISLIEAVSKCVDIPVIASGGFGKEDHLLELLRKTSVDAVAVADALHYSRFSILELRKMCQNAGREMRRIDEE